MALTFVGAANAPVGTPIHVTVYSNGVAVDPTANTVTWSGLPASMTVAPDAAGGAGGYVFNGTAVAAASVTAHDGVAVGNILISFTAPPLQFTSP